MVGVRIFTDYVHSGASFSILWKPKVGEVDVRVGECFAEDFGSCSCDVGALSYS